MMMMIIIIFIILVPVVLAASNALLYCVCKSLMNESKANQCTASSQTCLQLCTPDHRQYMKNL